MATVNDLFKQAGLIAWWNTTPTQLFNGSSEKGTDFGLGSFDKPVGSLTDGRVVYVGDGGYPGSSIGKIVQVLMPDGRLIHYQHLYDANVVNGQTITAGTIIGHSGGCPTNGYPNPLTGNTCTNTDQFSTGEHIEVRLASSYDPGLGVWSQAWISPLGAFRALGNAPASSGVAPAIAGGSSAVSGLGVPPPPVPAGQFFHETGQKIGLILLALVLASAGFYLAFSKLARKDKGVESDGSETSEAS